jgi:phosphopantothenoylcysteine decarboxylase / phosphopantothenate---cysteine ligase
MGNFTGKEIVLGVSGGIAAYKACEIVRELTKEGANVRVVLTAAGEKFITPLTLQTLSRNPVATDLFSLISESEIGHIALAQRADLLMIAPATANIIGKIRNGIADDMLSTIVMAAKAAMLLAPAMNEQMYASAAVQENLAVLKSRGIHFVEPDAGELACGTVGPGRLAEVGKILEMARIVLSEQLLQGKKVVVSAGPTAERIDPVRFLSNRASGKMGYAMARVARRFGADVTLVSGPTALTPLYFVDTVRVRSAEEMMDAVSEAAAGADVVVMCAAVADFRAARPVPVKIKKEGFDYRVELAPTVDILESLGKRKNGRILVGFAAETDNLDRNALEKMTRKNLDIIVANDVSRSDIGFESDRNEVRLLFRDGEVLDLPLDSKEGVAVGVWRAVYGKLLKP